MSILAQSGYGRGNKIEYGCSEGLIKGVIMSPRDEKRDRLEQFIIQFKSYYPDLFIIFDPQFYAATLNNPRDGHLGEYEYYNKNNGLGRTHFSGTRVQHYVKKCLDYQHSTFSNNVSYLVSPTVHFDSFRDFWSQVALNLAVESADYHRSMSDEPQPLLLSIVVSETAFQSIDAMEEYLDALTELDVEGFYLIIRRNSNTLEHAMETTSFSNFLYFCYVLSEINEYKVIVGYSDWHSFILEAVGVTYTACGWYQNLRHFTLTRFQPPIGGRRPRKRYSSTPLLSCPLITPELQNIYMAGILKKILSGSKYDLILSNGPLNGESNWSDETSCLAHWFSLNVISERINREKKVKLKLNEVELIIRNAQNLYSQMSFSDISFEPQTGPDHLALWLRSIRDFQGIVKI